MLNKGILSWVVFVVLSLGAGAVGGWVTSFSVKSWYPTLLKPPGTPAPWVFGPVWTCLYVLMATAAWIVWQERNVHDVWFSLALWFGQLILNAAWSFLFFGLRKPGLAAGEIMVLLLVIVLTAISFLRCSRAAFWLMTPYIGWVAYASYLNFGIWRFNRGTS